MHSASAQTGKLSEIVSVYMLTKCLQTTTTGTGTHKQRHHKTIQSRVVWALMMAVQATNKDNIHTIKGGVSTSEWGCVWVWMNDSACKHKQMGVVSRKEHDQAPILRINNLLCKWIAQSRKFHQKFPMTPTTLKCLHHQCQVGVRMETTTKQAFLTWQVPPACFPI